MLKVLGIDPGLASTGIAVVEGWGLKIYHYSFGTIQTDSRSTLAHRLNHIFEELNRILEDINPDAIVVEDVFSLQKYPKSGITLGQVSGVILLAAHQSRTAVREVAVREVKQVLTGNGNASKRQLEACVRRRLGHERSITPSHASDALALALLGLYRSDPRTAVPYVNT